MGVVGASKYPPGMTTQMKQKNILTPPLTEAPREIQVTKQKTQDNKGWTKVAQWLPIIALHKLLMTLSI